MIADEGNTVHFGTRLTSVLTARGPLCLGIDAHPGVLSSWALPDSAAGARELGLRAVDAAAGIVGVVKPQVAFFERFGSAGLAALEEVLAAARASGLLTIGDAKRGDIGSTMAGYADAWLTTGAPLEVDALTVSPALGVGALEPAFARATETGKGLFVLAATSNPEARAIQAARVSDAGPSVAAHVLAEVDSRNRAVVTAGSGAVGPFGVVVGATIDPTDLGFDVGSATACPILAPGFGAQGATPDDIAGRFGSARGRVIANVAREALNAGPDALRTTLGTLADVFRNAARESS